MTRRVHIVGGGLAGLSAALEAKARGYEVVIYEASPILGGRIRPVNGHDNGTHLLIGAYKETWDYLEILGTLDRVQALTPSAFDMREGPLSWSLSAENLFREVLKGRIPDVKLWNILGETAKRRLWEPMALAIYNTQDKDIPLGRKMKLFRELRDAGTSGFKPYLCRGTLFDAFVAPARDQFDIHYGQRLLSVNGNLLNFRDQTIMLHQDETCVLALPLQAYSTIKHDFTLPSATFNPITNIHFYPTHPIKPQFFGMINSLSQWVLAEANHICVTVSDYQPTDKSQAVERVWREIRGHLHMDESPLPEAKVVCEKFATPSQDHSYFASHKDFRSSQRGFYFAGDWTNPDLPCTIETAIRSGKNAISSINWNT